MKLPFRFVQTSDFHLERPPRGLSEVPDHLRGTFVDAPYRAAERVFDAAIKERVDFVLLCGDLLDPLSAGPRGQVFLRQQFQRLADKGITTYWSLGRTDQFERWGELGSFGEHVIRFAPNRVQRIVHQRHGEPLVTILGTSSPQRKKLRTTDFHAEPGDAFTLAVAYGSTDASAVADRAVNFWALGGEHDRRTLAAGAITVHYAGSPQGRRPQEAGPHGCTLVQVDENQYLRTSFIATDAVRYLSERIPLDPSITAAQLQQIATERFNELLVDPFGPDLLIHWTISGKGPLVAELERGKLGADLVARWRADHGQRRPAAWTVAIDPEKPADVPAQHYEEETVLGEFLRSVRHYVDHPDDPLNLEPHLAERHLAGSVGPSVALTDPAVRRRVLAEVARLGVELLSPEGPRS